MSNFALKRNYEMLLRLLVFVTAMAYPTLNEKIFHGANTSVSPAYYIKYNTSYNTSYLISQPFGLDLNKSEISQKTTKIHRIINRSRNSDLIPEPAASDFVFPGRARNFVPKQHLKNCFQGGIDICVSNISDYPYNHIKRILKNGTFNYKNYFTDDIIDVSTRFDEALDEEMACEAEETILYPKFGKTADNEMLFIINVDEDFKQGVRVEKCKKPGEAPCNSKLLTPTGYKTYCKQKYAYRKLLALQPNGEPMPDNFKIPSCCSCSISQE